MTHQFSNWLLVQGAPSQGGAASGLCWLAGLPHLLAAAVGAAVLQGKGSTNIIRRG